MYRACRAADMYIFRKVFFYMPTTRKGVDPFFPQSQIPLWVKLINFVHFTNKFFHENSHMYRIHEGRVGLVCPELTAITQYNQRK